MNKTAIIGIILAAVIAIIAASMASFEEKDEILSDEKPISDEILPVEENLEEPEQKGRNISVELTETVGLKSP